MLLIFWSHVLHTAAYTRLRQEDLVSPVADEDVKLLELPPSQQTPPVAEAKEEAPETTPPVQSGHEPAMSTAMPPSECQPAATATTVSWCMMKFFPSTYKYKYKTEICNSLKFCPLKCSNYKFTISHALIQYPIHLTDHDRRSQLWEWQFYIHRPSQTITLLSLYSPCCAAASSLD